MVNIELKNETKLNLDDIDFIETFKQAIPMLKDCHETIFKDVENVIGSIKIYKRERFFPLLIGKNKEKFILRININKAYGIMSETEVEYRIYTELGITLGFFSKYMEPDDFVDDLNAVIEYIENM